MMLDGGQVDGEKLADRLHTGGSWLGSFAVPPLAIRAAACCSLSILYCSCSAFLCSSYCSRKGARRSIIHELNDWTCGSLLLGTN